jgi:hypothetical protein
MNKQPRKPNFRIACKQINIRFKKLEFQKYKILFNQPKLEPQICWLDEEDNFLLQSKFLDVFEAVIEKTA